MLTSHLSACARLSVSQTVYVCVCVCVCVRRNLTCTAAGNRELVRADVLLPTLTATCAGPAAPRPDVRDPRVPKDTLLSVVVSVPLPLSFPPLTPTLIPPCILLCPCPCMDARLTVICAWASPPAPGPHAREDPASLGAASPLLSLDPAAPAAALYTLWSPMAAWP